MGRNRTLVMTGMLAGLSVLFALVMPRVWIGPFSATLGLHVPLFLSFALGPTSAGTVGLLSTIGFLLAGLPLVIVARAAMHGAVGLLGGWLFLRRSWSFPMTLIATAPLHGLLEAVVVIPFGFEWQTGLWLVGVGTLAHHGLDSLIALIVKKGLGRAKF